MALSPRAPSFVIGDLNHNLLNERGRPLTEVISTCNFRPLNSSITRPKSSSLIDLVLANTNEVDSICATVPTEISDHSFLACSLDLRMPKKPGLQSSKLKSRLLSEEALNKIKSAIQVIRFNDPSDFSDANDIWFSFKIKLLKIIDTFAPLKCFRPRRIVHPWVDDELLKLMARRNRVFAKAKASPNDNQLRLAFVEIRNKCKSMHRLKLKEYFSDKDNSYFKSSKKFFKFYKSVVPSKSSRSSAQITSLADQRTNSSCTEPQAICDLFNHHFSNYQLPDDISSEQAREHADSTFRSLKSSSKLTISHEFSFSGFTTTEIVDELKAIDPSSSPGVSNIPAKVLKYCADELGPPLQAIFTRFHVLRQLPHEWKSAIVTPLFKRKGDPTDCNNYRSISVIPPVAKVFEKLLCNRLLFHFSANQLLSLHQHGFRGNHSCETAVHSLLDDWKSLIDNKKLILSIFIDYTKAFDLIDHELLLRKLFHYGISSDIIILLRNYFSDRSQFVKIGNTTSSPVSSSIGLPQGSILGPTLFLIFINDISLVLEGLECILFADDTTIFCADESVDKVTAQMDRKFKQVTRWTSHNRMTINWLKTKAMFISRASKDNPASITIGCNQLEIVNDFKLLGIIISRNLDFSAHVSAIKKGINIRLFAIKKIYYLAASVKLQFFKSFILPYFDYCMSLSIYYSRSDLLQLEKLYNFCVFKLLKTNLKGVSIEAQQASLEPFRLQPFRTRVYIRLAIFVYNVYGGRCLESVRSKLKKNMQPYDLRSSRKFYVPMSRTVFGSKRLLNFLCRAIDNVFINACNLDFKLFRQSAFANAQIYAPKLLKLINFSA